MLVRSLVLLLSVLPLSVCGAQTPAAESAAAPAQHLEHSDGPLPSAPLPQSTTDAQPPADPTHFANAQEPALPLYLSEAIAMATRNSPTLQGAAATTARAVAASRTARAYTNPSVEVFEGKQYARPIPTPGVPGLLQHYAAYQTVEIPSERHARQRAAEFAISSSRFAEQTAGLSVTGTAKRAFYAALRQREEIRHSEENLQLVEDLRRRVQVQVDVGEKGRLELTRAEAELARAQFAVRSARLQYANSIAVLRAAIAAAPTANLDPQGNFEPRLQLPPLEEMRGQMLLQYPLLAQTQAEIEAAKASLDRERALRIPQPVAFGEFENQPDLRFWRAGFTIPIPLWDRRAGQVADARAAVAQSTALLGRQRLELVSALERAYEQYQLADQQATSLESGAMRAAESAVEAAKSAYRFGERGIVEVLDAQRVLQSVRGDLLDAQFARQTSLVDLEELGAIAPGAKP